MWSKFVCFLLGHKAIQIGRIHYANCERCGEEGWGYWGDKHLLERIWYSHTMYIIGWIIKSILIFISAFVVVMGLVLLVGWMLSPSSEIACAYQAKGVNLEYTYDMFHGCFVKYNDMWIPYDKLFVVLGK
jgi:hypothetical protein